MPGVLDVDQSGMLLGDNEGWRELQPPEGESGALVRVGGIR